MGTVSIPVSTRLIYTLIIALLTVIVLMQWFTNSQQDKKIEELHNAREKDLKEMERQNDAAIDKKYKKAFDLMLLELVSDDV